MMVNDAKYPGSVLRDRLGSEAFLAFCSMTGVYATRTTRFSHPSRWYAKNRAIVPLLSRLLRVPRSERCLANSGKSAARTNRKPCSFEHGTAIHSWHPLTGERTVPRSNFGFERGGLARHFSYSRILPLRWGLYSGLPRLVGNAEPPHLFFGRAHGERASTQGYPDRSASRPF